MYIDKFEGLVGKTISRVVATYGEEEIVLFFTDGSYTMVDIDFNYDDKYLKLADPNTLDNNEKVSIGLITQEEFDNKEKSARLYYQQQQERKDRARYEQLKAKFEGGK